MISPLDLGQAVVTLQSPSGTSPSFDGKILCLSTSSPLQIYIIAEPSPSMSSNVLQLESLGPGESPDLGPSIERHSCFDLELEEFGPDEIPDFGPDVDDSMVMSPPPPPRLPIIDIEMIDAPRAPAQTSIPEHDSSKCY